MILIDTFGLNNMVMEDLENISTSLTTVLAILASLDAADLYDGYEDKVNLAGVIYLHRISGEQWKSDTGSFGRLDHIYDEQPPKKVVLATNAWSNIDPETSVAREQQPAAKLVNPTLDEDEQLRHCNVIESAHQIICAMREKKSFGRKGTRSRQEAETAELWERSRN